MRFFSGHYRETPNITDITLPWLLFSNGAFEIFGEADDEDKAGKEKTPALLGYLGPKNLSGNFLPIHREIICYTVHKSHAQFTTKYHFCRVW